MIRYQKMVYFSTDQPLKILKVLPDNSLFFTREGHRRPVIGTAATKPLRDLLRLRGDIYKMAEKVIKLQLSLFDASQDASTKMDVSRVFMGCDIGKLYETYGADSEALTECISQSISSSGLEAQRVWIWEKIPYAIRCLGLGTITDDSKTRQTKKTKFENEAEFATDVDEWYSFPFCV
jgi:hypothetical protein